MEITKIKQAAEIAKSRTSDKRWLAAIDKAVAGAGSWVITELATCLAITTESGATYFANGSCQCEAYRRSTACKHRALYRLYAIASEIEEAAPTVSPAGERETIIAEIKSNWPSDLSLADELVARFRKNQLEMLSIDFLTAIRAAIV